MTEIERVTSDNTDNKIVQQAFTMMEQAVGAVPETLRLLANSPGLFEQQMGQIGYYRSHPHLSPELLTFIRYAAADWYKNQACIDFNKTLLKKQGATEQELAAVIADPDKAPLEEKERAMLRFVCKGVRDQGTSTVEDMTELCAQGWVESDIIDAMHHGFSMFAPGKMLHIF